MGESKFHVILRELQVMQYMDESLPFSLFIYFLLVRWISTIQPETKKEKKKKEKKSIFLNIEWSLGANGYYFHQKI